jgi:hypothetical protein
VVFYTIVFTIGGKARFLILFPLFELVPVRPTIFDRVIF